MVCFDEIMHERRVKCSVNPTTGREREFANPAHDGAGRTVAVVGGGPAGVTAGMVLRERGFRVVLFEPSMRLGGSLNVADKGFAREKITRYVDSMIAQVEECGVELRLGEEATLEKVQALSPCGVFVACGARPFIPPVPGIDGKNVVIAEDVLVGRSEVKGDCAIVGSGMTGLETAEFVMRAGHKTSLVDMLPQIGAGANIIVILDIKERMDCYEPVRLPGHRLLKITDKGIDLERMETGESVFISADTVILALGVRPNKEVVECFREGFPEVRVIGDAERGGRIVDATQDAYGQAFVFEP
jgi:pyruvate/2-oxoglutarate dehydrogenase complex dihydrolipoamide dehydrogenase (E3) component